MREKPQMNMDQKWWAGSQPGIPWLGSTNLGDPEEPPGKTPGEPTLAAGTYATCKSGSGRASRKAARCPHHGVGLPWGARQILGGGGIGPFQQPLNSTSVADSMVVQVAQNNLLCVVMARQIWQISPFEKRPLTQLIKTLTYRIWSQKLPGGQPARFPWEQEALFGTTTTTTTTSHWALCPERCPAEINVLHQLCQQIKTSRDA